MDTQILHEIAVFDAWFNTQLALNPPPERVRYLLTSKLDIKRQMAGLGDQKAQALARRFLRAQSRGAR